MNKSRKIFSLIIFAIILCSTFSYTLAVTLAEKTNELEKNLSSEAVLLMEASTGKVVYEKMNYQNYMARKELEAKNNYHYKQNMINVGNKDNLYNAMGLKGNYGGALRNGPKIVVHKK